MRYLDLILMVINILIEIVMFVFDIIVAVNSIRKDVKDKRIRSREKEKQYKQRRKGLRRL